MYFLLWPSPFSVSSFFQDHVAKVIIYHLHFVNLIRTLTSANHYQDAVNGNRNCSQTAIDLSIKLYKLSCFCDHDPRSVLTLNLKTVWDASHINCFVFLQVSAFLLDLWILKQWFSFFFCNHTPKPKINCSNFTFIVKVQFRSKQSLQL